MYFLYSLVLSLLFVALLPYFVYRRALRQVLRQFQRADGLTGLLRADALETIWFTRSQVSFCSATLIMRLRATSAARIVVSTMTITGQQLARSQSQLFDAAYFPFDWKFSVRRALDTINLPSIILETELWPNLRESRAAY
jgi:3-deoxy-D-manno-octulosonic-acid transferase